MVNYWSLPSELSTEQLKKFADEVRTVIGENEVGKKKFFQLHLVE